MTRYAEERILKKAETYHSKYYSTYQDHYFYQNARRYEYDDSTDLRTGMKPYRVSYLYTDPFYETFKRGELFQ